jgi:hypothetical protein
MGHRGGRRRLLAAAAGRGYLSGAAAAWLQFFFRPRSNFSPRHV